MADSERVALITGAARGIGRAIAERLSRDNVALVLGDVEKDELARTVAELSAAGMKARGLIVDIADEASVAAAFRDVAQHSGRLDILVNNAGIMPRVNDRNPRVEETPLDIWQQAI